MKLSFICLLFAWLFCGISFIPWEADSPVIEEIQSGTLFLGMVIMLAASLVCKCVEVER